MATAVWGTDAPASFHYVFNAIRSYGGAVFDAAFQSIFTGQKTARAAMTEVGRLVDQLLKG